MKLYKTEFNFLKCNYLTLFSLQIFCLIYVPIHRRIIYWFAVEHFGLDTEILQMTHILSRERFNRNRSHHTESRLCRGTYCNVRRSVFIKEQPPPSADHTDVLYNLYASLVPLQCHMLDSLLVTFRKLLLSAALSTMSAFEITLCLCSRWRRDDGLTFAHLIVDPYRFGR